MLKRFALLLILFIFSINIASAIQFNENFNDCDVAGWTIVSGVVGFSGQTHTLDGSCYFGTIQVLGNWPTISRFIGYGYNHWGWYAYQTGTTYSSATVVYPIYNATNFNSLSGELGTGGTPKFLFKYGTGVSTTTYTTTVTLPYQNWYYIDIYRDTLNTNYIVSIYNASTHALIETATIAYTYNIPDTGTMRVVDNTQTVWYSGADSIYASDIRIPFTTINAPDTSTPVNSPVSISYTISNFDVSTYQFYIRVYDPTGAQTDLPITTQNGAVTYDTGGRSAGLYNAYLIVKYLATSTEYYSSTDSFTLTSVASVYGVTRNARNSTAIGNVNVNFSQAGVWFNTTSDSSGHYNLTGFAKDYPINLNATKTGYRFFDYSYTPLYYYNYSVDLYLWDTGYVHSTATGIEGLTLASPFGNTLASTTVGLRNTTQSDSKTSDSSGYWNKSLADMNDYWLANASKSGYATTSDLNVSITASSWAQAILTLDPEYQLTISAKDSVTNAYLSTFTVNINGETNTTTTGSITFTEPQGLYLVTVSATGYYASLEYLLLTADTSRVFSLTPNTNGSTINIPGLGGFGTQRYLHYVQFIPQNFNGTRHAGITANYTATDSNGTTLTGSGVTGTDGIVGFEMTQNLSYNIAFTNTSLGINKNITLYPVADLYIVCIDTNCAASYSTSAISNQSLTNYTTNYTHKNWSIQNLTSSSLNSSIGLGPTGQGILVGIITWFVVGAGGPVAAIATVAIMALLNLVTWVMLLFCVMTSISVYVLRGWLG